MTEKKKKNALRCLYGRAPVMEILLIIFIVYLAAFCGTVVSIELLFISEPLSELFVMIALCLLLLGLTLYFLEMIMAHFKQCKEMETAYKALSGQEQDALLRIAASYQPKRGICFNETYLFGNMRQLRRKRKKLTYLPNFHYVHLQEIAWVYKIEQSTSVVNTTMMSSHTVQTYAYLRVHLYNGERLQGDCRYTDLDTMFELIRAQNPNCKIGYRKEWEEYFK